MKIFLLRHITPAPDNKPGFSALKKNTAPVPYEVLTLPDTALTDRSRPFFIPDMAQPCRLEGRTAFRIGRLGRHVDERFAHRYLNACTAVAAFSAPCLAAWLTANGLAPDPAYGFDGSICCGAWQALPTEDDATQTVAEMHIQIGGQKTIDLPHPDMADVYRQLAFVSSIYKIAEGDILLAAPAPDANAITEDVQTDVHVDGYLAAEKVLSFNIK